MNHCRRCQSDYEKPGTCNCYAAVPLPAPAPVVVPYIQTGYYCYSCGQWVTGHHYCWRGGTITVTTKPGDLTVWYDMAGNRLQVTPT